MPSSAIGTLLTILGSTAGTFLLMSRGLDSARFSKACRTLGAAMMVLTALTGAAHASGLRLNLTPSLPRGWYRIEPVGAEPLARGTIVCLDATDPRAPRALREGVEEGSLPASWRQIDLLKTVGAVAGDLVDYHEAAEGTGHLRLGRRVVTVAALRRSAPDGRRLPQVRFPVRVGPGEVWLHAEHPNSFDSRYFGPVAVEALSCTAEALWTW